MFQFTNVVIAIMITRDTVPSTIILTITLIHALAIVHVIVVSVVQISKVRPHPAVILRVAANKIRVPLGQVVKKLIFLLGVYGGEAATVGEAVSIG